MNNIYYTSKISNILDRITVAGDDKFVYKLAIGNNSEQEMLLWFKKHQTEINPLYKNSYQPELFEQIQAYLEQKIVDIEVTYQLQLSAFQTTTLSLIKEIPFGQTKTYGMIAKEMGNPKAYRAIGNVCNANPLPLIIPCHRVVGQAGIGGYSQGVNYKKILLEIEATEKHKRSH